MIKTLLIAAATICSQFSFAQKFEWVTHSSQQYPFNTATPVTTDVSGNVYALIHTDDHGATIQGDSILELVPGSEGVIIAKFDPNGNLIWGKMVSCDGGILSAEKIAVDIAGSVYVSFYFGNGGHAHLEDTIFAVTGTGIIIKLNSTGSFARATSTGNSGAPRLATLGIDLYVSALNFVSKLDSTLTTKWSIAAPAGSVSFDNSSFERADLFAQSNGELAVSVFETSNYTGPVPFGNDTIHFTAGGFNEVAVIKMDTSGQVQKTEVIHQASGSPPAMRAVCLDVDGNFFAGLSNMNAQYVFGNDTLENSQGVAPYCAILKWDTSGAPVWAAGLYPSNVADLQDLAINGQNEVLACGQASSMSIDNAATFPGGSNNFFLIKFDANKLFKWYEIVTDPTSNSYGSAIAVRNGNEYITGGAADQGGVQYQFGCLAYTPTGGSDFIAFISEQEELYPTAAFTFSADGLTYNFSDASVNATAWHWDFGDGDTSNLADPSHTYTSPGTYTITLSTYHNACVDDTSITIQVTGIEPVYPATFLNVYPILAADGVTVEFALNVEEEFTIEIISPTGRVIKKFSPEKVASGKHRIQLPTADLAQGSYLLRFKTSQEVLSRKLVVQ